MKRIAEPEEWRVFDPKEFPEWKFEKHGKYIVMDCANPHIGEITRQLIESFLRVYDKVYEEAEIKRRMHPVHRQEAQIAAHFNDIEILGAFFRDYFQEQRMMRKLSPGPEQFSRS